MMRRLAPAALAGVTLLAASCDGGGTDRPEGGAGRLRVAAAVYPLAEAARQVGGKRVDVTEVTPAGAEPHDIELSPRQVDRLHDADLVLYLGQGFQPAVEEVVRRARVAKVDLLARGQLLEAEEGLDPHVWLDPREMARIAREVSEALARADPPGAGVYAAGADAYVALLEKLDADYQAGLAQCQRRTIVTAHAAFGYLARRYGLTQRAIAGLEPGSEPDASRLAELADEVRADGTTTVFYEALVPSAVARTLAREAGLTTAVLDPIEGLTPAQVAAGATYESVMRANLASLREALGCR